MSGWRYLAIRFNGDGTQDLLHPDLPLSGVSIQSDLSGPGGLDAFIAPEVSYLRTKDDRPVFEEWSTVILAEKDGRIRGGGILEEMVEDGPKLSLRCTGATGYAHGMPYLMANSWIDVDPLHIVRHIWLHLQEEGGGNLGLRVVTNDSPERIGKPERDVNFTTKDGESVEFTSGPYTLAYWNTHNLGGEIDELAKTTPFQYRTSWAWEGENAIPTVEYRYPSIGRRLTNLRFVVGENVKERPQLTYDGSLYATDVLVLGAGSGRDVRHGSDRLSKRTRLRRVAVLEDKSITSNARAKAVAMAELKMRQGEAEITDLEITNHGNALMGTYDVGDEILVTTESGWTGSLDVWCKIISLEINPVTETVYAQVIRTERVG